MRASELNQLIVTLLSSTRKSDDPRYCSSLTSRQITESIECMLAPDPDFQHGNKLRKKVDEQLEILESEFEIQLRGDGGKRWLMALPSLIIDRDTPLRARYVGDRAYFNVVVNLLGAVGAVGAQDSLIVETSKTASEAREVLEPRGISVPTEEMMFEILPYPALPTEIELRKAELLLSSEISGTTEVYVPRRALFEPKQTKRWFRIDEALPSEISQLRRIREKSSRASHPTYRYLWEDGGKQYRLMKNQAFLAMYRIDIDRNAARLLDLGKDIPASIKDELPAEYKRFFNRYTERWEGSVGDREYGINNLTCDLRVRSKYKRQLEALLAKLGINKE